MPTREKITAEIHKHKGEGQDTVRRKYVKELQKHTKRDTILYFSSFTVSRPFPVPGAALAVSLDDIQGFMASLHGLKGSQLDLLIHSPGGSVEAADQIVQYLRAKYDHIRVIVPQNAMSAATMLACAADEIVMGKHSAIGPIDPQIMMLMGDGTISIPAHAILKDFDQARTDVAAKPELANLWAPRFASLPAGILNVCEQATLLATEKVGSWLAQYMFRGQSAEKPTAIAKWLADFNEHKTHGRPIGVDLAREKGLVVSTLESDPALQEAVLSVFHAVMASFHATTCVKLIENHLGKGHYVVVQPSVPGSATRAQSV